MDTSAEGIVFDEHGQCNYCRVFMEELKSHNLLSRDSMGAARLESLVERVRRDGENSTYDCIVGVSGGVDSSWALVKAVELGLRPLAVHMDNGWDSELAVNNIANLIEKLNVDLFTYVVEWTEYRKLMQAFFDADVVDIELLYDNAMLAVCFQQAAKYRVKSILSGSNTSTEGLRMPKEWAHGDKWDARNIVAISSTNGVKIKSFPLFSNLDWLKHHFLRRTTWIPFLDYLDYKKDDAITVLVEQFGYKPYPYKHYESVFTRFYQGFLLPEKFGVDKRRVHLSSLIITGQLTRDEALNSLTHIPYPNLDDLQRDKAFFLKKMNWSGEDLDAYLRRPRRSHSEWPTDRTRKWLWPILTWGSKRLASLRGTAT
jgi:N-acetyl sugar amidotransferase